MSDAVRPIDLPYATGAVAGPSHAARVWAGIAVMVGGLILIVFGGCFCIGVLIHLRPVVVSPFAPPASGPTWMTRDEVFLVFLYIAATVCFIAGGLVTLRGLKALLRIAAGPR